MKRILLIGTRNLANHHRQAIVKGTCKSYRVPAIAVTARYKLKASKTYLQLVHTVHFQILTILFIPPMQGLANLRSSPPDKIPILMARYIEEPSESGETNSGIKIKPSSWVANGNCHNVQLRTFWCRRLQEESQLFRVALYAGRDNVRSLTHKRV